MRAPRSSTCSPTGISAGAPSVIQIRVDWAPEAPPLWLVASPSMITLATFLLSWPVTTRRIGGYFGCSAFIAWTSLFIGDRRYRCHSAAVVSLWRAGEGVLLLDGEAGCGNLDRKSARERNHVDATPARSCRALAAPAAGTISTESLAQAPDKLKVAISQRGFWDSSFLEFAQKEGFLKEANLDVEFFYTEGGGQTLQVVTSGSVDVAMSNGLLGTIGAFSKGAPIRAISAQMTGAQRAVLVRQVRQQDPQPQGRRRQQHHRVLGAGLVVEPHSALAAQAGWLEGEADRDRRAARHAHIGDDRPDRHRLGGAAICVARATGEQDHHRGAGARGDRAARTRPSGSISPTWTRSRPSAPPSRA